jgi:hypothetical protein
LDSRLVGTEIRLDHLRMGQHIPGSAARDDAASLERDEFVTQPAEQRHVVLDDHNAAPGFGLHLPQQRTEVFGFGLGDARRWLVEEQYLRVGGEHARQFDDASRSRRQVTRSGVRVATETELLHEFVDAFVDNAFGRGCRRQVQRRRDEAVATAT